MVFSPVPVYLDPPNWHQQVNHHHQHGISSNDQNPSHHQLPPLPPPPPQPPHVGGGAGSIRPGSMADRARLAKVPQPETSLKCPRCDSTNTKFCYFNNYSLTQPRHFCKTCRRYWTKGGALRNVPVGGGCRRNKKSKSSNSSKSPVSTDRQMGSSSSSTSALHSEIIGHLPQQAPQFPFLGSLHNLTQYGMGNLGLNFGGMQAQIGAPNGANSGQSDHMGFNIASTSTSGAAILSSGGVQQFPFFEPPTSLFPFQSHEGVDQGSSSIGGEGQLLRSMTSSSRASQPAPVKLEETPSRRQYVGASENNQYWGANNWSDLSNVNSSATNNLL